MQINDRIYGKIKITQQVIIELINSKPMQRLKKISQDGAAHFIQPVRNVNRFEHSVGVWYLSHKYKRSIEEQIASLLHDVPHTAFSHVIDFVVNDKSHTFHEKFAKQIILDSEIPAILKKHHTNIDRILDKVDHHLLENSLPDISVDRWDYFMRDGFTIGFLPKAIVNEFLSGVYVSENKFYFKELRLASLFAILYLSFSRLIWLDPTSHGSYFLLVGALKLALKKKLITEEDFFADDEILMAKLKNAKDAEIDKYLKRLKPGNEFVYSNKSQAEFFGINKPRYVDPLVKTQKGLQRVSKLVPSLEYFFKEFSQNYKYLGVVKR